jgi:hypothetical protein
MEGTFRFKQSTHAGRDQDIDTEERHLGAMASLGDDHFPVAAVSWAYGIDDQHHSSFHRDSLIQKQLIWSPRP